MKLLKKLLPIASVASVAAIVAPIATSCGSNSMFDGYNILIPKSAKAVWDREKHPNGYKDDEAINLYLTDVKNNPNVFSEDVYLELSMDFINERAEDERYNWTFKSEANIKYENIVANPVDSTLSFKVSGFGYLEKSGVAVINLKSFSFDVKNIPYIAEREGQYGWNIKCNKETLPTSEGALINATVNGYFASDGFQNFNNESFIFDKDHPYEKLTYTQQVAIENMFETFASPYDCYHMQDIPHYVDPEK